MTIKDTSNTLDTSIYLKASLKKNMVGDNYFIEDMQEERDRDWEYRYNLVDIEEENEKQVKYTHNDPVYTPIEVVINHVKGQFGDDLGTDWSSLSFKKLRHPNGIGKRYRFSTDFFNVKDLPEDIKHYKQSIWICVNKDNLLNGNSCVVRRCNSNFAMVGKFAKDAADIKEIHYEPVILENNLKYMQVYYNITLPVPQAEWYAIMQLNYFTNFIKINDRFLFGTIDNSERSNNQVFKVKAVIKATSQTTFQMDDQDELNNSPLIVLALDKDNIGPDDDIKTRVVAGTPVYLVDEKVSPKPEPQPKPDPKPKTKTYEIRVEDPFETLITQGQTNSYTVNLYSGEEIVPDTEFDIQYQLKGIKEEKWSSYFIFTVDNNNTFSVKNLKPCVKGKLIVNVTCSNPKKKTGSILKEIELELGGFY